MELVRDVDRRPRDRVGLRPDHAVERAGLDARLDLRGDGERAPREPVEVLPTPLQIGREPGERVDQHEQQVGRRLAQAAAARSAAPPPAAAGRRRARSRSSERPGAARPPRGSRARRRREAAEPRARDAAAEPRRRRLLQPVRLVEDHRVVLGQDAAARREVGEVERVVRDHELGLPGACARRFGEARPRRTRTAARRSGRARRRAPPRARPTARRRAPRGRPSRSRRARAGAPRTPPRRARSRSSIGPKPCSCLRQR